MFALANRIQRPGAGLVSCKSRSTCITPALPRKATASPAVKVVAFLEDEKRGRNIQQTGKNIQQQTGRNIQQTGRNIQQRGKQALNKGQRQVNNRFSSQEFEDVAVRSTPGVYVANAAVLALFSGLCAASPYYFAKILFQPEFLSGLLLPLFPILSLGYSAAAVTNYVQNAGAVEGELDSTLHKRLNASLSTFSVAQLLLLGLSLTPLSRSFLGGYPGTSVLNTAGVAVLGVGVAIQLYVASVNFARNAPEGYNAVEDVKAWFGEVADTFNGIDGAYSAGYALLTVSLFAAGLGYLVLPGPTLAGVFGSSVQNSGPASVVVWQLIGVGLATIVAPITLSLKEGAAASVLSDARFKLLNIALLTAGVGHWLVLQPRLGDPTTAGPLLPVILATWATAALLGGVNLLQRPMRD